MPALNMIKVLDALDRESLKLVKSGDKTGEVQYSNLVKRLAAEYPSISSESVPVLASRYLKMALAEGLVTREKRGRNVFYRPTGRGKSLLARRQDQLDTGRRWFEEEMHYGYMSFALAPKGAPIIGEYRVDESIRGVKEVVEVMKKLKEKNPDLDSIILRFE